MPDDFKLSHNETLADLQQRNDVQKLNDFIAIARRTVAAGAKFSLTDTLNGTELSIHVTYTTQEEVEKWVSVMNQLRSKLGLTPLG